MNAIAKCTICNVRPVPSKKIRIDEGMDSSMLYCIPCYTEAGWENAHADGHDAENQDDSCWLCFPELNEATKAYAPRTGTSREGMVVHVTIRASALDKAAEVIAQIPNAESYAIKIVKPVKRNGHVTKLTFTSATQDFDLRWDQAGRFVGGTVSEDGKARKVRNVAEALRLAA